MPVLTHAAIIKYVPLRRRREIRDHQAPGLYLVIQVSGSKSWAMRFRRPDGKPAKLTLGPVNLTGVETNGDPVLGASLTLRQARQLAIKFDRDRAMGIDVVAEERSKKQRAEVAEASTFGAAARDYFIYHRTRWGRPRHWRREARLLGLNWPVGCDLALTAPAVIPDGRRPPGPQKRWPPLTAPRSSQSLRRRTATPFRGWAAAIWASVMRGGARCTGCSVACSAGCSKRGA